MSNEFIVTYMKLLEIIQLIKKEKTGTPEEFRATVNISKHQSYNFFKILKNFNCNVKFDHKRKTYYFTEGCNFKDLRKGKYLGTD